MVTVLPSLPPREVEGAWLGSLGFDLGLGLGVTIIMDGVCDIRGGRASDRSPWYRHHYNPYLLGHNWAEDFSSLDLSCLP